MMYDPPCHHCQERYLGCQGKCQRYLDYRACRDAELEIDYKQTKSIDGTYVNTFMGEESKEQMKSMAMAAGASLAGIIILGPIGVIGGAFVKGKNIDLPAGTEFYIQTKADTQLFGVVTTAE